MCAMTTALPESNAQGRYRLVFWNVENLFDCIDDSCSNDDVFTPHGDNHWTYQRYRDKLNNIYKTLTAMGFDDENGFNMPLAICMAEVENDKVLRDLCNGTPLRRYGYSFVHFDSPDKRGIDNALLYRRDGYSPYLAQAVSVSDSANGFFSRDILLVEGTTSNGDTLIIIVNHFPSRLGGAEADSRRQHVARKLRNIMDTVEEHHPCATIVVTGDFNASPDESVIRNVLLKESTYTNLMEKVEPGHGSYKYHDHWSCIDQIMVSRSATTPPPCCKLKAIQDGHHVFDAPFLLVDDEKYLGKKILRTYVGMKYQGGYSDHLPVYVDLEVAK